MPEIRYFTVTETREVKVTANSAVDASRIAAAAFEHGQDADGGVAHSKGPEGVWGNTHSRIRVVDLAATERPHR